jgi:xylose isomerase
MAYIFIAHVSGMDIFARALLFADNIITQSGYLKMRKHRYASFDSGKGAEFESGKLSLTDLREIAVEVGEPDQTSGKQEMLEQLINWYI